MTSQQVVTLVAFAVIALLTPAVINAVSVQNQRTAADVARSLGNSRECGPIRDPRGLACATEQLRLELDEIERRINEQEAAR